MLIAYPHGLGDCLMLTPTLRELHKKGVKVTVALKRDLENSKIFDHCPYVDSVLYVFSSPSKYPNLRVAEKMIKKEVLKLSETIGDKHIVYGFDVGNKHKIFWNADRCAVKLESTQMEVFTSYEDVRVADKILHDLKFDQFGFVQTNTASKEKDFPAGWGDSYIRNHLGLRDVLEIGKTFKYDKYNINVQFELLRRATSVCLPDSVFYHACSAMNRNINFVYFSNSLKTYKQVRNLNPNIQEYVRWHL